MQPQAPNPNPNLDFIMQSGQPAKSGMKLPGAGSPKMIIMAVGGIFGIALLIVIYSVITGSGSGSAQTYSDAMARGQEIIRVSTSVETLAQDAPTQNLAVTAENVLTSQQTQLTTYLTAQKITVSSLALNADKNTATDTQMQTASTNGNLNTVFAAYLKQQLQAYAVNLQSAYKVAGPHGKSIISDAFNSTEVILTSPTVANAG